MPAIPGRQNAQVSANWQFFRILAQEPKSKPGRKTGDGRSFPWGFSGSSRETPSHGNHVSEESATPGDDGMKHRMIICARLESAVEFAAKAIYVCDTVGHVFTIFPHAGEGRIANGAQPPRGRFYWHVHFNNSALLDRYITERSENAILVFRGDGHAFVSSILRGKPLVPAVLDCRNLTA